MISCWHPCATTSLNFRLFHFCLAEAKRPKSMLEKEKMAPKDSEFNPSGSPPALPETPGKLVATESAPALKASAVTKTSKWSFWLQRMVCDSSRVALKNPAEKMGAQVPLFWTAKSFVWPRESLEDSSFLCENLGKTPGRPFVALRNGRK